MTLSQHPNLCQQRPCNDIINAASASRSTALLTASKLAKTVQVGEQTLSIIKDVDIYINAGEFVVIMGKSGSGKSTLGLLAALDYPQ